MAPDLFQYLLNIVFPSITKKDAKFRKAIQPAERSCLAIHYLEYGGSQQSLSFWFRIGRSTISGIINETCAAILGRGGSAHGRIFLRPIQSSVDSAQVIVRAANVLHNSLRQANSAGYYPGRSANSYNSTGKLKEGE